LRCKTIKERNSNCRYVWAEPKEPLSVQAVVENLLRAIANGRTSVKRAIANFTLFVTLTLAFLRLPGALEFVSLDWSWNAALSYFAQRGLQFGTDIVYTYGPLGYLHSGIYAGFLWEEKITGALVIAGTTALPVSYLIDRGRSVLVAIPILLGAIFFARFNADAPIFAAIAIVGSVLLSKDARVATLLGVGALLGFLSLGKFTYLLLSAFAVVVAGSYFVCERQVGRTVSIVSAYFVSLLFFWHVGNQDLAGLPNFLRASWEVAGGYGYAMFTPPRASMLWLGVLQVGLFVTMVAYLLRVAVDKKAAVARLSLLGGVIFLGWKQAFVRADDGHTVTLFILAQYLSVLIFVLSVESVVAPVGAEVKRWHSLFSRRKHVMASGILLLLSLGVSYSALAKLRAYEKQYEEFFSINSAVRSVTGNAQQLGDLGTYRERIEESLSKAKDRFALPRLRARIGKEPVDVFGNEVGIAILNGLNYTPRPMFQSFSAYTSHLLRLNEEFYYSDAAPRYVIFKHQTIDEKFPTESDSRALDAILRNYSPVDQEGGYTLWERRAQPVRGKSAGRTVRSGEATLNEPIRLDRAGEDDMQSLVLDLNYSFLGRIRAFLFQPAELRARVTTERGEVNEFRLTVPLAREGIVVNPPLRGGVDFLEFLRGRAGTRIVSVELRPKQSKESFFAPSFKYSIREEARPIFVRLPEGISRAFVPFSAEPLNIKAAYYPRVMSVNEEHVLFVHAPSEITFDVPATSREIQGRFGVMPGAFEQGSGIKGVTFRVEAQTDKGTATLYKMSMRNSGSTLFRVTIPLGRVRQVVLRALCEGSCEGAWSYWGDISFSKIVATRDNGKGAI
jgi:hypothetical protein